MISNNILDKIFPVPELAELAEEKVEALKEQGFVITNFQSGGIFYTLLMILLEIRIEFIKLCRTILNQMYITHASGVWLNLKAGDYSKERKAAVKTTGKITLTAEAGHDTLAVPAGTVFKTDKDINGEELRYFSTRAVTFMSSATIAEIPVEAEKAGADYNVAAGQIKNCLVHLEGVTSLGNLQDWIMQAGADEEEDELLRQRTKNSWAELATGTTAAKYKSLAEKVDGVLYAEVNQLHPRGQGTVDIIITSTAGVASQELLDAVAEAVSVVQGEYDNVLVKSAVTVACNMVIQTILPALVSTEGVKERIEYAVIEYFKISTARELNELILLDIAYAIKNEVPVLKNLKINAPEDDIILETGNVIILGTLQIDVIQE